VNSRLISSPTTKKKIAIPRKHAMAIDRITMVSRARLPPRAGRRETGLRARVTRDRPDLLQGVLTPRSQVAWVCGVD
jgi:hypothetical protein